MENNVKVLFVQEVGQGEFETESIWCTKDGESYIVDNIPFIAKRIALGDTFRLSMMKVKMHIILKIF
jgi:hypothetical protein